MKVYITKYALTDGIYECETDDNRNFLSSYTDGSDETKSVWIPRFRGSLFTKSEWSGSADLAIKRAEKMRDDKIVALKKQIEKLSKMKFVESDITKARQ